MLDLKFIRENPDIVKNMLTLRGYQLSIDQLLNLDAKWRMTLSEADELKHERNTVSKEISQLKREGKDTSNLILEMQKTSQKIKELDDEIKLYEKQIAEILLIIPNMFDSSVPVGKSSEENVEVKQWGELPKFDFEPKAHWEIGELLDIIDSQRASKIASSNFALFKGLGARLQRALINFMIDLHTNKHGYTEVSPPLIVSRASMTGTGQLPKFEDDMYWVTSGRVGRSTIRGELEKIEGETIKGDLDDFFLIPTSEVPLVNLHAGEILDGKSLPFYYTAYTPCFRREAGSYGKETRGLIRIHQFDKVEMVKIVKPETSYAELEKLLQNAEEVLQILNLPYRVISLCSGDLGFWSTKTYDIEVWAAAQKKFLEVSSCSNCEDYQARRANIRFRREPTAKPELVHTLNGSGVALPRLIAAILENYQQPDGSVIVPEGLRQYMNGLERIC